MCTIVFAWDMHPRYRLVFAGNRDEFHQRPTQSAHWWHDRDVLAGKDQQAGGTWLGLNSLGHFAVVTNFREGDQAAAGKRSRGELVTAYLDSDDTDQFRQRLDKTAEQFSGYNLIFGDLGTALYHYSNRGRSGGINREIHGLSNHLLDTPWPKVNRATRKLRELLNQPTIHNEELFVLLADRTQARSDELPDTGVGEEMEQLLSPTFIVSPLYGTRSSTVILLDNDGHLTFAERSFDSTGTLCDEKQFGFKLG